MKSPTMTMRWAAVILAFLAASLAAAGQAAPGTTDTDLAARLSAILEGFPAETSAARDALCAGILKLGPAAVAEVCARVQPPAAGNDAKARFAVNGLAVYVTRAGAEAERVLFVQALLDTLAAARDKNVAAFFLSQVQLSGKVECVAPLERYLRDEALAGPAAAALRTIGGREAVGVFMRALDAAPPSVRLPVVEALGAMRSREAVKKLMAMTEGGDEGLRRAARFALANIGDPAAQPTLAQMRIDASFEEREEAPALYLLYARRLAESGRTVEGLAVARAVLGSHGGPSESQVASEALALIVSALKDDAVPDLLRTAASPVPALREAALDLATPIGGKEATAQWIALAEASASDIKAAIIAMLGRRGDAGALPFVRESLRSPELTVRLAAIPAAARLGGEDAIPELFRLIGAEDEAEVEAVKTALLGFDGGSVVPGAVRVLDTTPLPGKAALIGILGEKGAAHEIDRIFTLASDAEPATRTAALGALAQLAGEPDLPRLIAMLETASESGEVLRLQEAIAAAARRVADPSLRGAALVALLEEATPARQTAILRVLPKVGGEKALQAVVRRVGNADPQLQTAAVYALSQWPDYQAAGELFRIAAATGTGAIACWPSRATSASSAGRT